LAFLVDGRVVQQQLQFAGQAIVFARVRARWQESVGLVPVYRRR
jgi:hypothetical protein